MKKILSNTICVLCLMLFLPDPGSSQNRASETYSFEFRGEKMADVLDHIARNTELDLVYDPELVRGLTVYKRIQNKRRGDLLSSLLKEHRLDYITLSSGTVVIVRSVVEEPSYGTYAGKIIDRQTGEPLPGASVMLADASGGTSTNRSGTFSMNRVMSGSHQIIISYLGYESVYKTIDIEPGGNIQERISLTPKRLDVAPVVIEAHRPRMPNANSGPEVNTDEEWLMTAGMQSPIRSLSLVSGVQYGLSMTDLHLQGGQQSEHRMLLDGVPVYNPYSFGRMFSSFSPHAIGSVRLHRAGYGVEQGSQTAGLIDLSHDLASNGDNNLLLQGDPLSLNLRGDLTVPVKKQSDIHVMAAIRTNYWDIYRAPVLEQSLRDWDVIDPLITNMLVDLDGGNAAAYSPVYHDSDVDFFDVHVAAGYNPDEFSSLQTSFYMAENVVRTDLLNQSSAPHPTPRYLFSSDYHGWDNLMGQVEWNRMVTPRLDIRVQTAYSQNRFDHTNTIGTGNFNPYPGALASYNNATGVADREAGFGGTYRLLPSQIEGNSIRHLLGRTEFSYSFAPSFTIDAGLQLDRIHSDVEISNLSYLPADTRLASTHVSTYLNARHTWNSQWRVNYGSRLTWLNRSGKSYAEPRASIQFDEPDAGVGYWSARLAGGLYRQFVNENDVTNVGATSIVPAFTIWSHADESELPKSYHLTGSFLAEPSGQTSFSLEAYYKWQPVTNITSYSNLLLGSDQDRTGVKAFAETTTMRALGGGIRFNQSLAGSRLRFMAGYDYSYTQLHLDTQFGKKLPAPWNEPHRTQMRAMWKIVPDLTVAAIWQGVWGRSWGFRQSYYNYLQFQDAGQIPGYSFDNPADDKPGSFQQVDLSFIYQPAIGVAEMDIRLELINVFNRMNVLEQSLIPLFQDNEIIEYEIRNRYMPGFYPSASIQVKF